MSVADLYFAYYEGNKKAKEELMKRCLAFVKRKIYANDIKCRDQKDELVMQVIIKILNKMDTFKPNHNADDLGLWPWLATICYTTYMDFCRKQKKVNLFISINETNSDGSLKSELVADEHWLKTTSNKETLTKLDKHAKLLPEKQFTIIKLKYWFNMSYTEIAAHLNESENNVRVLQHRALKKLHILLNDNNHLHDNAA